ncbi:MAG: hypothetical protein PWQ59_674 [Thermoanaerobacterium sp.]|jgi:hypothetical protein|nr:hypothetical protein [Thermoanaerobacterium sp.]
MKPLKNNTCNKGSLSVEASLVFPIVIFVMIAVIYICLLLYQNVLLQVVVDKAVERAAANMNEMKIVKSLDTGEIHSEDLKYLELYRRFFHTVQEEVIKKYAQEELRKYNLLDTYSPEEIKVKEVNYIIYKKLTVEIRAKYKIPVDNIKKMLGIDEGYTVKIMSSSSDKDPAELIRNTDFIMDFINERNVFKSIADIINRNFMD